VNDCWESIAATLYLLPVNDGCGVWMAPLTEIRTIAIPRSSDNKPYIATITFVDGQTLKAQIGEFGGRRVSRVRGLSALGKYALDVDKVATITLLHERHVLPLPNQTIPPASANQAPTLTVTCKNGASYALGNANFYAVRDDGLPAEPRAALDIRVGESTIEMESGRFKAFSLKGESNKDAKYLLTTSTGDSVEIQITKSQYVGGTRSGRFAYVGLDELRQLAVTPK
jgi:hypothetical protein